MAGRVVTNRARCYGRRRPRRRRCRYRAAGDVIVADDDGVCVVKRADAATVLAAAQARGKRGV